METETIHFHQECTAKNRTPRVDVETETIHFTQDDHHSIPEGPTHDAPIGSRTPVAKATGEDDPRKEWKVLVTFSVTPVPMEHSSNHPQMTLTVARLYIEPTLPEGREWTGR